MDVDFVLCSCQNNEKNYLRGRIKKLNTRFLFKVQEGNLLLCSALESLVWAPMSRFRHLT